MFINSAALDRHRSLNDITRGVAVLDWPSWRSESKLVHFETGVTGSSFTNYPNHLIFPTSSIFSLSCFSPTGSLAEASLIGNEGCVGLWLLSRNPPSPISFVLQTKGFGLVISAEFLKRELSASTEFRQALLNYSTTTVRYAMQTCFCYRHHTIEQQVTKMILLTLRRTGRQELEITHQMIGTILGIRREGVSAALKNLHERGFLTQRRGVIRVDQRKGLESTACECYPLLCSYLGYNHGSESVTQDQVK